MESRPTRGPECVPFSEHGAKIDVAHHGKLFEILRGAIDVGADIEQHRRGAGRGGKDRGQRGTVDAGNRAQHDFRRGHGGAGVAGGDEAIGLAFAHHAQADAHGGVALGANRLHLVFHGDVFAGVDDFDGQARGRGVAIQFRLDLGFGADQQHAHAVLARGVYRALNLRLGRAVGTHRIQRDHARHGVYELAGFFDVEDFASLIVTALGAGAVRHLLLVTVGALGKGMAFQSVMGAPGGSALLGVSTFWIRHG